MKHLKEYINESILSSTGSGLTGMTEGLKNWFLKGCRKSGVGSILNVNIEQVGDRFDIVIPKTEKFAKSGVKNGNFLKITNDFDDPEKWLSLINSIRTEKGTLVNLSFNGFNIKTTKNLPLKCSRYIDFTNMTIDVFDGAPTGAWTVYFNHFDDEKVKVKSFVNVNVGCICPASHVFGKSSLECKLSDFKDCGVEKVGNMGMTREIDGLQIYPNMFNTKDVYDENAPMYLTKEASAELDDLFANNKWKNGLGISINTVRIWNAAMRKCTTVKFDEERNVYKLTENWLRCNA